MIIIETNKRVLKLDEDKIKITGRAVKGVQIGNILKFTKDEFIKGVKYE